MICLKIALERIYSFLCFLSENKYSTLNTFRYLLSQYFWLFGAGIQTLYNFDLHLIIGRLYEFRSLNLEKQPGFCICALMYDSHLYICISPLVISLQSDSQVSVYNNLSLFFFFIINILLELILLQIFMLEFKLKFLWLFIFHSVLGLLLAVAVLSSFNEQIQQVLCVSCRVTRNITKHIQHLLCEDGVHII